ncbi:selenide, water dikinase SelD [Virgibacillus sp. W0181]|uniref:selenide, water dikinase SelD n=1 Tax=Virgibacillus sp. W0181 TaxID=3391581 RepID=UPI003F451A2B
MTEKLIKKDQVKLTSLSSKGGCGCKINPLDLSEVLRQLPKTSNDPNLLVGLDTSDDAGVYRINDDVALVQTLDFFTPIVDDPYMFGQIAAANALSDVYAMGGTPLTAMNIVGFPIDTLDKQILTDILTGASHKVTEAGATLVGGHSIDDKEPKFGLSVTGTVHPNKIKTNNGAQVGDKLILTKPIGVGILTTSIKKDMLTETELNNLMELLATLNKTAAETMQAYTVHASTDVTGFSLLGHASEMAKGSDVGITIHKDNVPLLERVRELAEQSIIPGGAKKNHQWLSDKVVYDDAIDEVDQLILSDPVTSGGLLIAVPADEAEALQSELQNKNVPAAIVGTVTEENTGMIHVE